MISEHAALPDGRIQYMVRADHIQIVQDEMERIGRVLEHEDGLINWFGPKKSSNGWAAYGFASFPNKVPKATHCSDEQGDFGIENAPETYGERR